MLRGTKSMIRTIILLSLLTCPLFPAIAQEDKYCIPSAKLTQMRDKMPTLESNMQRAYNELFELLLQNNESDDIDNAGCVTQQDLAQICKNVWDDDTETCEAFIYDIMDPIPQNNNYELLEYSGLLNKTNFDDIDAEAFNQAVNKTLARRRDKHIGSKLQDMGTAFLEQAKEKQINPFISVAISMYESTYGTSTKARKLNNIAGLRNAGGYIKFASVPDSIASQAATIQNFSNTKELNALAKSGHYCAKSVATKWASDVRSIARVLYRNYNAIVQSKK